MPRMTNALRVSISVASLCAVLVLAMTSCTHVQSASAPHAHAHESGEPTQLGEHQSPIDLPATPSAHQAGHKIELNYHDTAEHLIHREHTIELRFDPGSELEFDGRHFLLDQLHFHTPSEHLVAHQRFPVELHLVHRAQDDSLLVLGVLFEVGPPSSVIERILTDAPRDLGQIDLDRRMDIGPLFPEEKHFYAYEGSLTTAPYTEGVQWLLLSEHPSISAEQVVRLLLMEGGNARSVQPINERIIEAQ